MKIVKMAFFGLILDKAWKNCNFWHFLLISILNRIFNDAYWVSKIEKWSRNFWKFSKIVKIRKNLPKIFLVFWAILLKIPPSAGRDFGLFFTILRFSKFQIFKNRGSESGQMTAFSHFISDWNKNLPF